MFKEQTKNALLFFEVIIMFVFLLATWSCMLYGDAFFFVFSLFGTADYQNSAKDNWLKSDAVLVRAVSVAYVSGGKTLGVTRERASSAYERCKTLINEAVGSAGEPEPLTDDQFSNVLDSDLLYVMFDGYVPLALLAVSYDKSADHGKFYLDAVDFVIIAANGSETDLLYRSGNTGEIMRCATAARSKNLLSIISETDGYNSKFAKGSEDIFGIFCDEMLVVSDADIHLNRLSAVDIDLSAGSPVMNTFMEAFEVNPYTVRTYSESDGWQVYVQDFTIIRTDMHSRIELNASESSEGIIIDGYDINMDEVDNLVAAVEDIAGRINRIYGALGFESGVHLRNCTKAETNGDVIFCFGCSVNGVPIASFEGTDTAVVTVHNSKIVSVKLNLRIYRDLNVTDSVMPDKQIIYALINDESYHNANIRAYVCYVDDNSAEVRPEWCIYYPKVKEAAL